MRDIDPSRRSFFRQVAQGSLGAVAAGEMLQATAEGKKTYNQRMHIAETPFAVIKGILEVRRFLLRGLEKVRTEWRWVCTAHNLKKLIAAVGAVRAESGTRGIIMEK